MMKKDVTCGNGIYTKWPKVDKWEAQIGSDRRNLGNLHRLDLVATYQITRGPELCQSNLVPKQELNPPIPKKQAHLTNNPTDQTLTIQMALAEPNKTQSQQLILNISQQLRITWKKREMGGVGGWIKWNGEPNVQFVSLSSFDVVESYMKNVIILGKQ